MGSTHFHHGRHDRFSSLEDHRRRVSRSPSRFRQRDRDLFHSREVDDMELDDEDMVLERHHRRSLSVASSRGRRYEDDDALVRRAPRARSSVGKSPTLAPDIGRRRPHSSDPATRKRYSHAVERAIGAGSAAAFHVHNGTGSWVGSKGLKVAGAASAAARIDYVPDQNPKERKARHIGLSMFQSGVIEAMLDTGEHKAAAASDHGHRHHHHRGVERVHHGRYH